MEAKTREPDKPHFDVGNQLHKALGKEAQHPRIVCIDMNVGYDFDPETLRNLHDYADELATRATNWERHPVA